jgi:hypothetical protein
MTTTKPTFWEWFDGLVAEAAKTEEGKTFAASNFTLSHNGGGTTAWQRDIDDDWHILVTDSEGCTHTLMDPSEGEDFWIVGAHSREDGRFTDCKEAKTVEEAIAFADEMDERIRKGDFEGLNVQ